MFNNKINKTVTLWLLDKNNVFLKTLDKFIEINLFWKERKFNLEWAKDKQIYWDQLINIIELLKEISNYFDVIFAKELYHKFNFDVTFQWKERKKLKTWRIAEKSLNNNIWKKYKKQFKNFERNLFYLKYYNKLEKNNLERISNIVRTIRYLQNDLEKLFEFIKNYKYYWYNKGKKKLKKYWKL